MSRPIEDYALIGDGETAALVSRDGSVDWLCWPRFDDDACFAALLGTAENGCWSLAPVALGHGAQAHDGQTRDAQAQPPRRGYLEDTLVVQTEFDTGEGSVRLTDFMPRRGGESGQSSSLVRIVEGLAGAVTMRSDLRLRFDYGMLPPWSECDGGRLVARLGPDLVVLHAPVPLNVEAHCCVSEFTLRAGERQAFVLRYGPSHGPVPGPVDSDAALEETVREGRGWIARFDSSRTDWPAAVKRSLITLRALIHQPSGGLVAAPTTSLPEAPGGAMNWDYRYSWLRDASFTVGALLNAGFREEATRWRDWLLRAVAGSPERLRIMYRVDGARHLSEWEVEGPSGYRYATPIRVGNAASTQHQIDVFGEVLNCLHLARLGGVERSAQEAIAAVSIAEHIEKVWSSKGSGIWESRAEPRHYTYSKVMAWVGIDRVLRAATQDGGLACPDETIGRWRRLRQTIHDDVCREGWNEGLGSFTQYYGGQALDASLLLMPLVGFLPATDRRMSSTIDVIGRQLSQGGLVRRKAAKPGGPDEGTFLACACWLADCLHLQGRTDEARAQFERVLAVSNDLGLLSEEYNVPGGHLAGNFPQALTHLAVVNTALGLCGPVLHRGGG